ncbi:MAG: putative sensor protein, partial [Frankiales bacterium]|nr:putative sensor protein [Frankiales bacterium]
VEYAHFEERMLQALDDQETWARLTALAAQLQVVSSGLAAADTLEEIAEIAVAEGRAALGATGGTMTRPRGDRAVAVLTLGSDVGMQDTYDLEPTGPHGPSTDAIRSAAPVFISGKADRDALYPYLAHVQPEAVAIAAVPLTVVGEAVGALRFTWALPRLFSELDRFYLAGLAAQTAQAVARSNALHQLQEAEARSRVLALLGERLAADRSIASLAEAVLDAVIPLLGDWAMLHLVDATGGIYLASGRHRDRETEPVLNGLFGRFRVTRDQPYGAGKVIVTGTTQELPAIDEALLQAVAPDDDEFVQKVLASGVRTGVIVPLVARGATVGALSLGRGAALPAAATVAVLEDIGRRAGVAFDNARALSTSVRLDLALSAANVGSFEMRVPTGEVDWDERLFAMLDIDPNEFDGTLSSFFSRVLPEDAARTQAAISNAVETVGELAVEYRVLLHDGSVRWLEGRGQALPGADGTAERLVGVVVDVTDKRDQSTLARRSLELMADAFMQLDRDWTMVYVNNQAEELIRRTRREVLGTSFWDVFPEAVGTVFEERYRHAARSGEPVRFEALFGPLETYFEVRAFPGSEGLAVYFTDIGERRKTEQQRDRALERLQLLNDVGADLTATLDVEEALTRLALRMVPVLGDLVSVDLSDSDDVHRARSVVVTAADPARADAMREAEARAPRRHNPESAVHKVLHGEPILRVAVEPGYLQSVAVDEEQLATYLAIDMRYATVVPLIARGRVFGVLSLIRTGPEALPYTPEEEQLALELGRRAGLIVDHAAQNNAQRRVAEGLQRSLLPDLPAVKGLRLGACYEPSSSAAKVGGDWYDAFVLPDGSLGLVIGDVMGHDIAAAAAMGQLRSVLRTCAVDGDEPGQVVDRLDRLVTTFAMADLATVIYARIRLRPDGSAELSWSNAGHPPPLLLAPGHPARFLEGGASTMIGVEVGLPREPAVEVLPPGSTLLMYTDGLVERRGAGLDQGLDRVRRTADALQVASPGELCDQLIAAVRTDGSSDDVALVALTLG